MLLVGEMPYHETSRLGVARRPSALTIIDGGVTQFTTGQVSNEVITGFLRAATIARFLQAANASASPEVDALTYLAGPQHAGDTRDGIERAITTGFEKVETDG